MSRKRGKLSLEEEKFILDNRDTKSISEMADALNRNPEPVKRFLTERASLYNTEDSVTSEEIDLRRRLHTRPYWSEILKQFSKANDVEELQYFEALWVELMKQFRQDVLMTEELEIKQWLTLEVLMNRSMKERKRHIEEIERLQRLVDDEYKKNKDDRDKQALANLEAQLAFARNSVSSYTNEHTKLLDKIKDIRQALKAARADRIKKIEDGKVSFVGLIRQLEEEDIREREGLEAEIVSIASIKAKKKMGELHQYNDSMLDIPILTPETVINNGS